MQSFIRIIIFVALWFVLLSLTRRCSAIRSTSVRTFRSWKMFTSSAAASRRSTPQPVRAICNGTATGEIRPSRSTRWTWGSYAARRAGFPPRNTIRIRCCRSRLRSGQSAHIDWILLGAQFVSTLPRTRDRDGPGPSARRQLVASRRCRLRRNRRALHVRRPPTSTTRRPARRTTSSWQLPIVTRASSVCPTFRPYVQEVSEDTDVANAYAYGFGPTRRIVFWDTFSIDPFAPEEQQVRPRARARRTTRSNHLAGGIGWFAIFAVPGALILCSRRRGRGGWARPEAVPLALLVAAVFQLATAPAANWVTRRMEAEADWKALEAHPRSRRRWKASWSGFSETSLGDPAPPAWAQLLLGTHPPSPTASRWPGPRPHAELP